MKKNEQINNFIQWAEALKTLPGFSNVGELHIVLGEDEKMAIGATLVFLKNVQSGRQRGGLAKHELKSNMARRNGRKGGRPITTNAGLKRKAAREAAKRQAG